MINNESITVNPATTSTKPPNRGSLSRLRRIVACTVIAAGAAGVGAAPHTASAAANVVTHCNSFTNQLTVSLATYGLPGASRVAYRFNIGNATQWVGWDGWYYLSTDNIYNHIVTLPDGGLYFATFELSAYYPATGSWSQPQRLANATCRT